MEVFPTPAKYKSMWIYDLITLIEWSTEQECHGNMHITLRHVLQLEAKVTESAYDQVIMWLH